MFDFGKSLLTMSTDEQKKAVAKATPAQRNTALEMGISFNGQFDQKKQQRQQKRDRYHDLDRLNFTVEKENEAHDFFGKGLGDWQKGVTGNNPSKDAGTLKKQFDDYEQNTLSRLPKDGKRHTALSKSLPKIKDGFLKQGHQFAMDKLNERSRDVLGKGLKRIANNALGAKDDAEFQLHDDQAAELINQYVLSEATFDEKDADSFYDQFLKDAGVPSEKELAEQKASEAAPLGVAEEASMQNAEPMAASEPGAEAEADQQEAAPTPEEENQVPGKSSAQHAREMEAKAKIRNKYPKPKENYPFDKDTYEFLGKNKDAINSAAGKFGVPPEAVAGALGDEYNTRRGLKGVADSIQDSTVNWKNNLDEIEQEIADGNKSGKLHGANWDIGPGNLNVSTLHEMFINDVEKGNDSNPLKNELEGVIDKRASRQEQWEQYIDYAKTPEGSATLASAYIQRAGKELEPYMEGLNEEEKMAALMTYYKQGPNYVKKYKQMTDKKAGADSAENNRPIKPGEGTRLLYQLDEVRGALH